MAGRGGLVGQGQGARAAIQGDEHEDRAASKDLLATALIRSQTQSLMYKQSGALTPSNTLRLDPCVSGRVIIAAGLVIEVAEPPRSRC